MIFIKTYFHSFKHLTHIKLIKLYNLHNAYYYQYFPIVIIKRKSLFLRDNDDNK